VLSEQVNEQTNGLLLISTNIAEALRVLTAAFIVTLKRQQLQMSPPAMRYCTLRPGVIIFIRFDALI
jgi:hypothetical protein